tara:strand:+ start:325 stop:1803 length:1479 start_codon:yes stop_codon:yes gene_type:complete
MARYESKSEEFGQELLQDQRKRADKLAKEQESFSKKITAAKFVAKGVNSYLNDRMDRFKTSMADEKAFLVTQQKNAASFLSAHTKNVTDKELTTRSYLDNINAEALQTLVEKNVDGIMVQVPNNSGDIVERPAYDIPKSTFRNLKDFTIGGKEYKDYETYIDEQLTNYNSALNHAQSVPSDAKGLSAYLDKYAEEQLPTNIFSFVTQGARKFLKGETSESLKSKINKTTKETLSDPRFNSFTNFSASLKAYNNNFPNKLTDTIDKIAKGVAINTDGKIIDVKNKKIISDIKLEFTTGTSVTVDAATNKKTTSIVALPTTVKTYVNQDVEASQGKAFEVSSGEDLLVIYNAAVRNSFNTSLTNIGSSAWEKYTAENIEDVNSNPMFAFGEFKQTDTNNQYFKPDLDVTKMLETFTSEIGEPLTGILAAPDPAQFKIGRDGTEYGTGLENPEYIKANDRHKKNAQRIISEMFETYMIGVNKAVKTYPTTLGDSN